MSMWDLQPVAICCHDVFSLQLQDHHGGDAADGEFHELLGDLSAPRSGGDTQHVLPTAAETGGD